jgi:hypothetical protein
MSSNLTALSPARIAKIQELLTEQGEFCLPPPELHPRDVAAELLQLEEFEDLREGEAVIDWLLRRDEKEKMGRRILGTAHLPRVQGELNPVFEWMLGNLFQRTPDFLIILDMAFWFAAGPRLREILVYHELSHCIHATDRDGEKRYGWDERPIWRLRAHDVEEFTSVVRRYGAWNTEIQEFVAAANHHGG